MVGVTTNPTVGRCRRCCLCIWDPEKKLFLRRSGKEWVQTMVYYSGFFAILIFLTAIMLLVFLLYLERFQTPWWELSSLGSSPGVNFHPAGKQHIIQYDLKDFPNTQNEHIHQLDDLMKKYKNQDKSKFKNCSESSQHSYTPCSFDTSSLGPCASDPYGYDSTTPCVMIKLNKVFGWTPKGHDKTRSNKGNDTNIKLNCKGHKPVDQDHIEEMKYYPGHGIPGYFFPYSGQENYLSPLVGVQIQNPVSGVVVTIECSASVGSGSALPSLIFELMVTNNNDSRR